MDNITRVFPAEAWPRMQAWAQCANETIRPWFYTNVVRIDLMHGVRMGVDEARMPTFNVDVDTLNGALTKPSTVTPLELFKP